MMADTIPFWWILLGLVASTGVLVWRMLYPKPYPGIPYNIDSAKRIAGDIPDLVKVSKATNEFSGSMFAITTGKLGTPIAQFLFPGFRKPIILLDDPREIENLLIRRGKEFGKSPMSIDLFAPMFPGGTVSQHTTLELKAQKRLWADVMHSDFLARAAGLNIHKATLDLLRLWRIKGSVAYKDQPFVVLDDFKNAALDAMWVALLGEDLGITGYEVQKLQDQISGRKSGAEAAPRGTFLHDEVEYISDAIARSVNSPSPRWSQKFESWTPRYRRFRKTVSTEIGNTMKKAVERFQRLELGQLENDESDTCMMDLVLRRQILAAKKAGSPPTDPIKNHDMLDEMFFMLVGLSFNPRAQFSVLLLVS